MITKPEVEELIKHLSDEDTFILACYLASEHNGSFQDDDGDRHTCWVNDDGEIRLFR